MLRSLLVAAPRRGLAADGSEREPGPADAEREGDRAVDLADRFERQAGEDAGPALVPDRRQGPVEEPELPSRRAGREHEDEGRGDELTARGSSTFARECTSTSRTGTRSCAERSPSRPSPPPA